MPRSKGSSMLATDKDCRELFVRAKGCGIDMLVILIDALPIFYFGKGKTPYLEASRVLKWFEDELQYQPGNRRLERGRDAYRRLIDEFQAGRINFT